MYLVYMMNTYSDVTSISLPGIAKLILNKLNEHTYSTVCYSIHLDLCIRSF